MKKTILLFMLSLGVGLSSCTKDDSEKPSNPPTPTIDYSKILRDNLWNFALIEDWLFINDYQIQTKKVSTQTVKVIEYKLFTDSLVVFFRNPQTNAIEPASYPKLTFVNDTLYYQRVNRNKQVLLTKK